MIIKITIVLLFLIAIIRYNISNNRDSENLKFYLFSSAIQSLMVYPVLIPLLSIPEMNRKLDFTVPYENYIGLLYPTIIAVLLYFISDRYVNMKWKEVAYPLIAIVLMLIYSYITPLNCSKTATTIFLFLFVQILIVVYVCKTCFTEKLFLKSLYDGFAIIVYVEVLFSITYVFLNIDFFQGLFSSKADDLSLMTREGSNFRMAMGTTIQHNRLGALCAYIYVFFLSCWLLGYMKSKSRFLTILSLLVVVLSQSRSAVLASLVSTLFIWLLYLRKNNLLSVSRLMAFLFVSLIGIFVFLNIDIVNEMFFHSNVDEMADTRKDHYFMGWLMLLRNDFQGCGLNTNTHYMYYELHDKSFSSWLYMHSVHNIHLVIAVETGLVGLILWFYFSVSRVVRFLRVPLRRMNNPVFWFTFVGMLLIMIVHGSADYVQLHYQYLMILFLFGAFYAKIPNSNNKKSSIKIG